VHGDVVGARGAELVHHEPRPLHHQVHVERRPRELAHGADDDRPERQVGYEMIVHDVAVHPIASGIHDRQLGLELREVGGQDAGCNDG
jgi:hypothetical protein